MLTAELKSQILNSLMFILNNTPNGKKITGCSDCLNRMLKQLESDEEPFLKYYCNQVVNKSQVSYEEVYNYLKSHWTDALKENLKRGLN